MLDRHTLRLRLKQPDYTRLHNLAQTNFGAVAREVAEHYGDDIGSHPVGTGPYVLKHWTRGHKIVLEANAEFREMMLTPSPALPQGGGSNGPPLPWERAGGEGGDEQILRDIGGKRLPLIGRIEIFVIEENQPRWLSFLNGEHDVIQWLPNEFIHTAAPQDTLAPWLAKRGIRLHAELQPRTACTYFNFDDPVVGGYEPHQVALRRAITLAYDMPEEIRILRKGQAIPAQGPIPPGVEGYDPEFRSPTLEYNPAKAKALLDMFGFVDRGTSTSCGSPASQNFTLATSCVHRAWTNWPRVIHPLSWRKPMKKPSLVTATAAAVIAFAAAAGSLVWAHDSGARHPMAAMHGSAKSGHHMGQLTAHIKAEAATTPQQGAQIDALVAQAAADMDALHAQMQQDHLRAVAALTRASVDRAELESVRQDHLRAADQGSRRITQLLADVAEVLTPEQRQLMATHVTRGRALH